MSLAVSLRLTPWCEQPYVLREEPGGGTIRAWRGMRDSRVASPILYEGQRRLALRHRSRAIGCPRSDGTAPLPDARLPRPRLHRRRCRSRRPTRPCRRGGECPHWLPLDGIRKTLRCPQSLVLSVGRARGCSSTCGAIPLSDTHVLPIYYTFTTLLWHTFRKGYEG